MTTVERTQILGEIMKKRLLAGAASAALLSTLAMAGPAQAAPNLYAFCKTTGASGGLTVHDYSGATTKISLSMTAWDLSGDDHHVRIRLVTKNHAGTVKYWPWRANTDGADSEKTWHTTASEDSGIHHAGIQVARFEKNTRLNYCLEWGYIN